MTTSEFAYLLRGKQIRPGKYVARCPAHNDKTPSLAISEGRRGDRIIIHCWAGCELDAILEAIGLRRAHLFYDRTPHPDRLAVARERAAKLSPVTSEDLDRREQKYQRGKIIDRYQYTDTTGRVIASKFRLEPKAFRWKLANGIWRQPSDCPIYNLHNVAQAKAVFIVEGEKDANALNALGFAATTAPNGAASWKPEYAGYLRGKRVMLLPDNDEPGREYAVKVAASLAGIASLVEFSEMPEGVKDVSDLIARNPEDPKAELRSLLQGARNA